QVTLDDLAQVLEQGVAAVLGGRRNTKKHLVAEGQRVGAADAVAQKLLDGAGHRAWVADRLAAELQALVRRGVGDAGDRGLAPAVEDCAVLGHRDLVGGAVQRLQVRIGGAAVIVAQLGATDRELGADLDHGQDLALQGGHALARRLGHSLDASQVGGRVLPAVRAGEVHELAGGQEHAQPLAGLVFAQEMVAHEKAPLRLPMPSDPDPSSPDPMASPLASASAASPCSTMSPVLNRIPWAISRQMGERRSSASRSMLKCLNSSPTASRMTAAASGSFSSARRCSYQPIASASSVSDAHSRAKVRVAAGSSSGGSWYWSKPMCSPVDDLAGVTRYPSAGGARSCA